MTTTWEQVEPQPATIRQRWALHRLLGNRDTRDYFIRLLDRETAGYLIDLCVSLSPVETEDQKK
jgi:hypothetical protein